MAILREWQRLGSYRDLKSASQEPIANLVDNEENRKITLRFRGEDAATVINAIDKVSQFQPTMFQLLLTPSICLEDAEGKPNSTYHLVPRLQTDAITRWSLTPVAKKLSC
jgi:hypothetical protein